ncbi:hypothetical protein [Bacillus vallismortis]|uniref:Uncharacterized protein n=1 Tax=Bacillus vallismortis TaxID=72361 RepID=A0AAP3CJU7_BACVA|nr:hypothetical protein [Bacillus vallismortis]MCI4138243.1 hypothetical protein [Bacillus vallismortis]MCY7894608.1 hypothetical protein [Bacillus vallismortis]MCY7919484.1 hypothetical protein [Bacillus vallismortis]MCY8317728.1 hypothetical protein [Bacillus vallismortis]MCY8532732.1 hypothetical protein [Bacillus vallismortis]
MTIIQRTIVVLIGTQLAASAVILFIFELNSYNHFSDGFSWLHFLKKNVGGFAFYLFLGGLFFLLIGMCAPSRKKKRISVHEKENSLK